MATGSLVIGRAYVSSPANYVLVLLCFDVLTSLTPHNLPMLSADDPGEIRIHPRSSSEIALDPPHYNTSSPNYTDPEYTYHLLEEDNTTWHRIPVYRELGTNGFAAVRVDDCSRVRRPY